MFSSRTKLAQENEYAMALKSSDIEFDLSLSNPTKAGLPVFTDPLMDHLLKDALAQRYEGQALGDEAARQRINLAYYPSMGGIDDLCLTASTSEAYGLLFKLLCEAGDDILVPEPSYPLFEALAGLDCVRLIPYPLYYDGYDWWIDFHTLTAHITPRTQGIIVVNPNNPTGHYLKETELQLLLGLGFPLIIDEVFRGFDLAEVACIDFSKYAQSPIFLLNGLSKSLGYPFLKVGWIKTLGEAHWKKEAMERLAWANDAYLSLNGLSIQLINHGLLDKSKQRSHEISLRIQENHANLKQLLAQQHYITSYHVRAGWMVILSLPSIYEDEAWSLLLLKHGILVQPGYFYDFHQSALVVISLLPLTQTFCAGVTRLIEVVTQEMELYCGSMDD